MRLLSLLCVTLLAGVAACATTTREPVWTAPAVIPEGWIHDFDYASSITKYLRGQYDSARLEGASAYIYVYSDSDEHCLATRRLMRKPAVAAALRDVRITMLNHDRLKWLHTRNKEAAFDPGDLEPYMAKLSINGVLPASLMYPDAFRYHPEMLDDPMDKLTGKPKRLTASRFAAELRKYFEAHNES